MFGIGMPELLVIMAIALIVIGPKKLPDLARSIGRALGEFKKATGELKSSLGVDEELSDVKHAFDDINQEVKDVINVDPLLPEENNAGSTMPDKTEPADATGNSPGKEEASDARPEKPGQENPDDAVKNNAEAADQKPTTSKIDENDASAESIVEKNQGETAGGE